MLYNLLAPLGEDYLVFNLFRYLSFRSGAAVMTSLAISFILGPYIIAWLKAKQGQGQPIREDGPESHLLTKQGTPTMGGFLILIAITVSTLLWADLSSRYVQLALAGTLWLGVLGFVDDYLKVVKKRPKGMIGRVKLVGQITYGLLLGWTMMEISGPVAPTVTTVPFMKDVLFDFGIFYIPLVVLVVTGTSNAVNLADGLDGLAIGLSSLAFGGFAVLAYLSGNRIFSEYLNLLYLPGSGD